MGIRKRVAKKVECHGTTDVLGIEEPITQAATVVSDEWIRERVKAACVIRGVHRVGQLLGLSDETIARLGGGLSVRIGTLYAARANITKLDPIFEAKR